jgi:hypothetical protein
MLREFGRGLVCARCSACGRGCEWNWDWASGMMGLEPAFEIVEADWGEGPVTGLGDVKYEEGLEGGTRGLEAIFGVKVLDRVSGGDMPGKIPKGLEGLRALGCGGSLWAPLVSAVTKFGLGRLALPPPAIC